MKNNFAIFTFSLLMLSAQSYTSAPAETNSAEGQPGLCAASAPISSVPGGPAIYGASSYVYPGIQAQQTLADSSASSVPLNKIYRDAQTQTEQSGHDEQINAQINDMLSSKHHDKLLIKSVHEKLSKINTDAQEGSKESMSALMLYSKLRLNENQTCLSAQLGVDVLRRSDLLEGCGLSTFRVPKDIMEAFNREGLNKK